MIRSRLRSKFEINVFSSVLWALMCSGFALPRTSCHNEAYESGNGAAVAHSAPSHVSIILWRIKAAPKLFQTLHRVLAYAAVGLAPRTRRVVGMRMRHGPSPASWRLHACA